MDREIETEVVVERKGGFFGKLLSFVLGIVVGAVGCIGGVGYAGYYAATQMQIQEGFDYLKLAGMDIDYTQYVNGKYGEATVMDLLGDVGLAFQEIAAGNGSLNTLNEISPMIATLIKGDDTTPEEDGVINLLKAYGVHLDGDAFMNRLLAKPSDVTESQPDVYLTDYIMEEVNEMPVGELLMSFGVMLDPTMMLLLYGTEGEDYEVVDGKPQMIGDAQPVTIGNIMSLDIMEKVNSVPLAFLLRPSTSDPIMMVLSFGPENRYTIDEGQAVMKQMYFLKNEQGQMLDDQGNVIANQACEDIDNTAFTRTLKVTNADNTVTTYYLKSNDNGATYLAYKDAEWQKPIKFSATTLATLQEKGSGIIDSLALKDVLGVEENTTDALMKALCFEEQTDGTLKARKISDLMGGGDFINDLLLKDILDVEETTTDTLMKALCFEELEDGTLKPRKISDLTGGSNLINDLYLKDILGVEETTTDTFMKALCFEEQTDGTLKPRKISDLTGGSDFINGLYLKDVLGVEETTTDTFMKALCFEEQTDGTFKPRKISDLTGGSDFINGLYLKDVLGVEETTTDTFMKALCFEEQTDGTLKPRKISDLTDDDEFIKSMKLKDVLNVTESSSAFMKALCKDDTTIGDLQNPTFINGLALKDVLDLKEDSPAFIKALCKGDTTIEDLTDPNFFNGLHLGDLLTLETDASPFIKALCEKNPTISELQTETFINSLELADLLGVTESSPAFIKALCKDGTTIGDLTDPNFFNGLHLGDLLALDEGASPFIKALCEKNPTISELQTSDFINGLELADLLGVDVTDDDTSSFMKALCKEGTTIGSLTDPNSNFVNSLALSDVLGITKGGENSNELLEAICFDKDGNSRTIGALQDPSFINDIPLSDILHVNHDNSLVMYLIYGKEGIHYKLNTKTVEGEEVKDIVMLQKRVAVYGQYVFDEYGDTIIASDFNTSTRQFTLNDVTYQLKTDALGTDTVSIPVAGTNPVQYQEVTATFYYVQDTEGNDLMFEAPTFGMLTAQNSPLLDNAMHHLTVADILGDEATDENNLLSLIGHAPIMDMSKEVEALRIVDIFEDDIYYFDEDGNLTDKDGNLTDGEGNAWTKESPEAIKPTWRYLLTDESGKPNPNITIKAGMSSMMTNMTNNIQDATIAQLLDDEILKLEAGSTAAENYESYKAALDADPNYTPNPITNPKHFMFTLTISGLLDLALS